MISRSRMATRPAPCSILAHSKTIPTSHSSMPGDRHCRSGRGARRQDPRYRQCQPSRPDNTGHLSHQCRTGTRGRPGGPYRDLEEEHHCRRRPRCLQGRAGSGQRGSCRARQWRPWAAFSVLDRPATALPTCVPPLPSSGAGNPRDLSIARSRAMPGGCSVLRTSKRGSAAECCRRHAPPGT